MHEAKMSPAGGPILSQGPHEPDPGIHTAPRPPLEEAGARMGPGDGRMAVLVAPSIPGATLEALERYAILRTLQAVAGSTGRAAAILKISPRTIQYKLKKYRSEGLLIPAGRPEAPRGSGPRS